MPCAHVEDTQVREKDSWENLVRVRATPRELFKPARKKAKRIAGDYDGEVALTNALKPIVEKIAVKHGVYLDNELVYKLACWAAVKALKPKRSKQWPTN